MIAKKSPAGRGTVAAGRSRVRAPKAVKKTSVRKTVAKRVAKAKKVALIPGAGFDVVDGGTGFDYVGYRDFAGGITVDLAAGTAYAGGKLDALPQFEGVVIGDDDLGAGDVIEWAVPAGSRRLKVEEVLSQPDYASAHR